MTLLLRSLRPVAMALIVLALSAQAGGHLYAQDSGLADEKVHVEHFQVGGPATPAVSTGLLCPSNVLVGTNPAQFNGTVTTTNMNGVSYEVEIRYSNGTLSHTDLQTNIGAWAVSTSDGETLLLLSVTVTPAQGLEWAATLVAETAGAASYLFQTRLNGIVTRNESCTFEIVEAIGTIKAVKFEDTNGNQIEDPQEPRLAGWTIYLDMNNNAERDSGEPAAESDASGEAVFSGLAAGTYIVREVQRRGFLQTFPPAPPFHQVVIDVNGEVETVKFGNFPLPPSIQGQVFEDSNENGVRDPGEAGMDGVTVELLDAESGLLVRSTLTMSMDLDGNGDIDPETEQGLYWFQDLLPDTYIVLQQATPGLRQTVPTNPDTYTVTVAAGDVVEGLDFGNVRVPVADLSLEIEAIAGAVTFDPEAKTATLPLGDTVTVCIRVINNGPGEAGQVEITAGSDSDALEIQDVMLEPPIGACVLDPSGRSFTCSGLTLAVGDSVKVNVTGVGLQKVADARFGASTRHPQDPDPGNNDDEVRFSVEGSAADLSIEKAGPDSVALGASAVFQIVVSNAGPDDAPDVVVTDVLQAGLTFDPQGSDTRCTAAGQTVRCEIGTIAAGMTVTVVFQVAVTRDLEKGATVTNTATVSTSAVDPTGDNTSDPVSFVVTQICKAYIFIGDINGTVGSGIQSQLALWAANEAQSDYEKAGYTVVRNDQAPGDALLTALLDPDARAIWFLGHGSYEKNLLFSIFNKFLATPDAGLGFRDRYIAPNFLKTRAASFPNIEQVTLHSCSQDLPEWSSLFPTAVAKGEFDAWSTPTRLPYIYVWQLAATYPRCDDAGGSSGKIASGQDAQPIPPLVHERLWQDGEFTDKDSLFVYGLASVTNAEGSFVLNDTLASVMNGRSFNVWVTADSEEREFLHAATVAEGRIPIQNQSVVLHDQPDFDLCMTVDAYQALLRDPDDWPQIAATESVRIDNLSAALSPEDVRKAIGTLLWGYPYMAIDLHVGAAASDVVRSGEMLPFQISLTNAGPHTARGSEVSLALPEGATLAAPESDCSPDPSLEVIVCRAGDLAPGTTVVLSLTMQVDAPPGTQLTTGVAAIARGYDELNIEDNQLLIQFAVSTAGEAAGEIPATTELLGAFPNPFNPGTTIRYNLSERAAVRLTVYDVLGRRVRTLVAGDQDPGRHQAPWDGRNDAGEAVASGLYVYRLSTGTVNATKSMILLK